MTITVQYFGLIKKYVGAREETVTLSDGANLGDLLQELVSRHGTAFGEALFEADGSVKAEVAIMVAGHNALTRAGLQTVLPDAEQAEIVLLGPAITGG